MQHRDIEFSAGLTACPSGWRWVVQFDVERTKTGVSLSMKDEILDAQRKIGKALRAPPKTH
jgi:ribosomal protein S7